MWRNAVTFTDRENNICGFFLREIDEGSGEIILFFDGSTSEYSRQLLQQFVAAHIARRAVPNSISTMRIVQCKSCGQIIPQSMILACLQRSMVFINCPVCGSKIDISAGSQMPESSLVHSLDSVANNTRNQQVADLIIEGKRKTEDYDVLLCYNSKTRETVEKIGKVLLAEGILPWMDIWNLQPGLPWQRELERQLSRIKAAAVFIGDDNVGPWQEMEIESLLREFVKRKCPVIPVLIGKRLSNPTLPTFLSGMTFVDMSASPEDAMMRLIWGITGRRSIFAKSNETQNPVRLIDEGRAEDSNDFDQIDDV